MRCNSCSVVVLAGSAPGGRSGRRGQGRAGPQVARLLHRDEFDDHRVGTVILLVRNLEERRDDHRVPVLDYWLLPAVLPSYLGCFPETTLSATADISCARHTA